jgi:hypothetical protein
MIREFSSSVPELWFSAILQEYISGRLLVEEDIEAQELKESVFRGRTFQ